MICFRDRCFCSSLACTNKCGRKLTEELAEAAMLVDLPISYTSFCDQNGDPLNHEK